MDKKFIDAEMLKEEIEHNWDMQDLYLPIHFFDKVDEMPAADVQEVRHGKWKGYTRSAFHGMDDFGNPIYRDVNIWECSECCRKSVIKENYCPCCGARMDGC